jgi:hypothetical protein
MAVSLPDNIAISTGKPLDAKFVKQTIAERDAIPLAQRYRTMMVHVVNAGSNISKRYWLPDTDLTNTGWAEVPGMDGTAVNVLIQDALDSLVIDGGEVV